MDLHDTFDSLIAKYGGREILYRDILIELNSSYKAHILPPIKEKPALTAYQRQKYRFFNKLQETA